MADRRVWIGSIGPLLYDDEELLPGDTELQRGLRTDGQLDVASAPASSTQVLRLEDIGGTAIAPSDTVEAETAFGQASDAGAASTFSRGDHTHGTPADPFAWTKITAASVTLDAGTSSDGVSDLQTHADGNYYDITEAAATPGISLTVEFTGVTDFTWVQVVGQYAGSGSHAVGIQLYDWVAAAWKTFASMQNGVANTTSGEVIMGNHDFFIPSPTPYIGTGGDAGKVRVRFRHTMAGNASHNLHLDVVALYK